MIFADFAFLMTGGEWAYGTSMGTAEIFATTLVAVDRDTSYIRVYSVPTKIVNNYTSAGLAQFS